MGVVLMVVGTVVLLGCGGDGGNGCMGGDNEHYSDVSGCRWCAGV